MKLQQAIIEESEEVKAKTSVLENMMERLAKLEQKLKEKGKVKAK